MESTSDITTQLQSLSIESQSSDKGGSNSGIIIDGNSSDALNQMTIVLFSLLKLAEVEEDIEEMKLISDCLVDLDDISEKKKGKINIETDQYLTLLQFERPTEYGELTRVFRYYFGRGIYTDSQFHQIATEIYQLMQEKGKKEYFEALEFIITFFDRDEDMNPSHYSTLRDLSHDIFTLGDKKYDYFDLFDYLTYSLE